MLVAQPRALLRSMPMNRPSAPRPIETEREYEAMLEFLRELMRTQNVSL